MGIVLLLFLEIVFLVAGFMIILRRDPAGVFRVLFGEGQYELPPTKARLFGLLLTSPLLVSVAIFSLLGRPPREESIQYGEFSAFIYLLLTTGVSLIVIRSIKRPELGHIGYGPRLLLLFGLTVLSAIIGCGIFYLIVALPMFWWNPF